jgi:hypothetical protein
MDGYEGNVCNGLGSFNMAMTGHCGNNSEKVAGTQNVPLFLGYNLHRLGNLDFSRANDKKPVRIPFTFDNNIRVFGEINESKL